jgi:hypothetical protein
MLNKFILTFATAGAITAFAASNTYKVDILESTTVEGQQIKAGTYRIEVENNVATFKHGKDSIQVPARTETAPAKFDNTRLQYSDNALHEIFVGGTSTKIIFEGASNSTNGAGN